MFSLFQQRAAFQPGKVFSEIEIKLDLNQDYCT